jgi:peptidoglycan/xylan/chitin deacetylase (PgdA/CDA1 family)
MTRSISEQKYLNGSTQVGCSPTQNGAGKDLSVIMPILAYHQVQPQGGQAPENRGIVVDASTFRKQMTFLHSLGYRTIPLDSLMPALEGKLQLPRKSFILTFDDGYYGVYDHAFPILCELGFKATIFCVAETISGVEPMRLTYAYKTLQRSQLNELLKGGFSLGSHSYSHYDLTGLSNGEANREICDSRRLLEDVFGVGVTSFSYPYGAYSRTLEDLVMTGGYSSAVSISRGRTHVLGDRYKLKRLAIGFDQGFIGFVSRFVGFRLF